MNKALLVFVRLALVFAPVSVLAAAPLSLDRTRSADEMNRLIREAIRKGTDSFSVTAPGELGYVLAKDRVLHVREIRNSIVAGRDKLAPLKSLTLSFEIDRGDVALGSSRPHLAAPSYKDENEASQLYANRVVREMTRDTDTARYWDELVVEVSSRTGSGTPAITRIVHPTPGTPLS